MNTNKPYGHPIDAAIEAAFSIALDEVDDQCCDNFRVADAAVADEVTAYENAALAGCCGSFDREIAVGDRRFLIGFNYGH